MKSTDWPATRREPRYCSIDATAVASALTSNAGPAPATGQPLAEDTEADYGDEEKARAERFGCEAARERRLRSITRRTHPQMIWQTL
jgi:hypothetical protein